MQQANLLRSSTPIVSKSLPGFGPGLIPALSLAGEDEIGPVEPQAGRIVGTTMAGSTAQKTK
jgi:hypothetical protein